MKLTSEELQALLQLVEVTEESEIDCDQFLDRVASYVEQLLASDDPSETLGGFEKVVQHMKICPECREEFEALLRGLQEQP